MAEDGCYIVTFASMVHPDCPVDPSFVRGERRRLRWVSVSVDGVSRSREKLEFVSSARVSSVRGQSIDEGRKKLEFVPSARVSSIRAQSIHRFPLLSAAFCMPVACSNVSP